MSRPEPKRDRWGRYMLPHPETGKEQGWTRATTLAGTLSDDYNLTNWKMRLVALGIAQDAGLRATIASAKDKNTQNKVATQAFEQAGGNRASSTGTALHAFAEDLDFGHCDLDDIPDEWAEDMAAYVNGMKSSGAVVLPEWIERIVLTPELEVAGTLDRIVELDGQPYIADIKTGQDLSFSWMDISVQLAVYANAHGAWTGEDYEPLPDVSKDRALVLWLPAGKGEFSLWWVDIARGWELAHLAYKVRAERKAAKDGLAQAVSA